MTEHDLDDLASDLIDGLLPAERAADALRDPAVARRVEEMRAAQALLRDVPPPSPARREAVLAAALGAAPAASPSGRPGAVADLAAHRAVRRWRDPRWLSAAAVVLVVLAIGGLLAAGNTTGGGDSDSAAQVSDSESGGDGASTGDESGAGSSGGAPEAQANDAAPTTTTAAPAAPQDGGVDTFGTARDLGDVDSLGELADRAEAELAARADASSSLADEGDSSAALPDEEAAEATAARCPLPAQAEGAAVESVATARFDGVPVVVWVVREGDARRMIVVDGTCAVVGERTLRG